MHGTKPYPEVRALERGLMLLDALGECGWLGPTELARHTGSRSRNHIPPTVYIGKDGLCRASSPRCKIFSFPKLRALSLGVNEQDARVLLVSTPLRELVEEIKWPSDFAVLVAGRLVIMDSNHLLTPLTFYRSVIGQSRPIVRSSLGRAILSAMSPSDRAATIETVVLAEGEDASDIHDPR